MLKNMLVLMIIVQSTLAIGRDIELPNGNHPIGRANPIGRTGINTYIDNTRKDETKEDEEEEYRKPASVVKISENIQPAQACFPLTINKSKKVSEIDIESQENDIVSLLEAHPDMFNTENTPRYFSALPALFAQKEFKTINRIVRMHAEKVGWSNYENLNRLAGIQSFCFRSAVLCGISSISIEKSDIILWKKKCADLERDVKRKDKALAEASALLIFKKKAHLIWGESEDE